MSELVFGVKIILQDKASPVSQDTDIGLYNVAGDNSELRWIQNAISGVSNWADNMLVVNGIRTLSIGIDLRRGGSTSYPGQGAIVVKNNLKLWKTLEDAGINLVGLRSEVYSFHGTTPICRRTYSCEEPTWDGREYTIPLKKQKRSAQILKAISSLDGTDTNENTVDKLIPAVFGRLFPQASNALSGFAKFIRYLNIYDESVYTNAYFTGVLPGVKIFPITAVYNDYDHGTQATQEVTFSLEYPENIYVFVVGGTGQGQIREIEYFNPSPSSSSFTFQIKYAFLTELSAANDDTRSWVQFIKVNREYAADSQPCKDFLESVTGNAISIPELFSYANKSFNRIADFGLTIRDSNKNSLDVQGTQFSDNIDNLDGYTFLPVSNLALETKDDLTDWSYTGNDMSGFTKHADGLYKDRALETGLTLASAGGLVDPGNAVDRDYNTYAEFNSELYFPSGDFLINDYNIKKVLKFNLPELPDNITEIDSVSLIIKMHAYCSIVNSNGLFPIKVILRRFAYTKSTDVFLEDKIVLQGTAVGDDPDKGNFDDTPAFYANNAGYLNFYRSSSPYSGSNYNEMTGVANFTLTMTKREYLSFVEGGILIDRDFTHTEVADYGIDTTDYLKIYEIGIAFKMQESSIENELFSPLAGRIFNSTWGARKTSSALMSLPKDIFESLCRLQNYQDTCSVPTFGWGLHYADAPQIATSGFGSFDDIDTELEAAGQIIDETDGYTDTLKQFLCRDCFLANWQDSTGQERLIELPSEALAPIFTVQLGSVLDRQKIKVIDARQQDIFPEPFVRYEKNSATGEYEKQIAVYQASAGAYSTTYVDGVLNPAEAQELWQTCHSLSLKSHQTGKPPTDLTDLTFANGPGGYSIALNHIQKWVRWQGNQEIEFPLHVNDCLSWAECSPINVLFSHQTDNAVKPALVENIDLAPYPPYEAIIRAIIYA